MKYGAVLLKQMVFVRAMLVGVYLLGGSMFLLSCILLKQTRDFERSGCCGEFVTALFYRPDIIKYKGRYYLHTFPYPIRLFPKESAIIKMAKLIKYENDL